MIKKILAAIIWFFAIFCELFVLTLVKLNTEGKYMMSILPLLLDVLAIIVATKLWSTSFDYNRSKVSLQDKRKRIILQNMPLYINMVCFLPSGIYYLIKRKDLDSRQRKSLMFSFCFTFIWLLMVYLTV
ncbi:MAG: hypothetical protein Q4C64_00355 [Erysipelotrichia bacterium]|nr:hypothetical protein [Erysipelotrichia bacterium]